MKKQTFFIFFLSCTLTITSNNKKNSFLSYSKKTLQSLYAAALGKKDASPKYKKLIEQALLDFDINPSNVIIKRMNSVGPRIAGCPLSSFTKYGIWINEDGFKKYNQEELEFQAYHEAAHYAFNDHLKETIVFTFLATISTYSSYATYKQSNKYTKIIFTPLTLLMTSVSSYHFFTKLIQSFEKKADLAAAKKLCIKNKKDIVINYLHSLQNKIDQNKKIDQDVWHPSIIEQEEYLRKFIEEWNLIND